MNPEYIKLYNNGNLHKTVNALAEIYESCILCPHECKVNRRMGEKGICRSTAIPKVASYNSHHGEEPPISGTKGSGTIFLSGCTGRCLFCQNYPISQLGTGKQVTDYELATMMLDLQSRGCHNINFVTPTHFLPSIISALYIAAGKGLDIPLVYNTSGYEKAEIIKLIEGIFDIYLPDSKYSDDTIALKISGFRNYVKHNRESLQEMFRQTGNLVEKHGIAQKGTIVRHLILPGNLSGTDKVLSYLGNELSEDIYISLMDQYFPAFKALEDVCLSRKISLNEYNEAIEIFYNNGLHNGWIQEHIE